MPDSTPYNIQITLEEEIEIKKKNREDNRYIFKEGKSDELVQHMCP
jgi:hypothetical protein